MRTFATYIEYLLMTRHYCYVPGRGAYMLVDEPAEVSSTPSLGIGSRREHVIAAPHRVVRFSPLHAHDDGMLANLLMEAEGMTFDEACRYIDRHAAQLDDDFLHAATLHTDVDNFGFASLRAETWADLEARLLREEASRTAAAAGGQTPAAAGRKDTIEIPKYWLKRAAVAMMAGIFFFTNFIGLNQGVMQKAGVIDMNALHRTAFAHTSFGGQDDAALLTDVAAPGPAENALAGRAVSDAVAGVATVRHPERVATVPVSPLEAQPSPIEQVADGTTYFIVGFCTWTERYAHEVLARYKQNGYPNAGILVTRDLYRVFVDRFTGKEEAMRYLLDVRKENDSLRKSWMLPFDNDGSLSPYIIKNTYNDNQLSMELSHPHQRTERDQG